MLWTRLRRIVRTRHVASVLLAIVLAVGLLTLTGISMAPSASAHAVRSSHRMSMKDCARMCRRMDKDDMKDCARMCRHMDKDNR
jgi:hypothetical protein